MDIRYNISQLFEKAFGIELPVYFPVKIPLPDIVKNPGYTDVNIKEVAETPETVSYLGTPILFPVILKAGQYRKYKANGEIMTFSMSDYRLPPVTLVDFRRAKNIVKTDMLGSDGTVKEIYGFDDWIFTMRGLALNEPGYTAAEQINGLLKFESLADSVEVEGELFAQKDITRIVLEDIELGQLEGQPGTVPFTIRGCSDNPIELVLTEKTLMS